MTWALYSAILPCLYPSPSSPHPTSTGLPHVPPEQKVLDISTSLEATLDSIVTMLSSHVLHPSFLFIDQCGIHNLGADRASEWGICWAPSPETGESEEYQPYVRGSPRQDHGRDESNDKGAGKRYTRSSRRTLMHILTERALDFCLTLDQGQHGVDVLEDDDDISSSMGARLKSLRNGISPCAVLWKSTSSSNNNQSSTAKDIDKMHLFPVAWLYFKLGNYLVRRDGGKTRPGWAEGGRNHLTSALEGDLESLYFELESEPVDGWASEDQRRQHQFSWYDGSRMTAQADRLGELLLQYLGPPDLAAAGKKDKSQRPLTWREKWVGSFDVQDKSPGLGLLPWRIRNIRRSVDEYCVELQSDVLSPLENYYLHWARGVLDSLRFFLSPEAGSSTSSSSSSSGWSESVLAEMERDLTIVAGLMDLPWQDHYARAVQDLLEIENELIDFGQALQFAMNSGWALVEEVSLSDEESGSEPFKSGGGSTTKTRLRRVLLPPRRQISRHVSKTRIALREALDSAGMVGLGNWRGGTSIEERRPQVGD